ncbi:6-phosphogluconolactonase protein [Dioscorea alata]|uniref:6-phosphogluconolactonase protein n=1 Tax=Dioscorea alata TaxID=55571 RepID=A0ACB7V4K9_DIOAL|nr:6-phosphogluconolactonase protein [Dioscorea alata]
MVYSAISLGSTALSVHLRRSPAPLLPPILCTTFTSHRSIFVGSRFAPISVTSGQIDPRRPFAMASTPIKVSEGKKEVLVFENEEELSVSLAKFTAELSEKYTNDRGAFTVVLSGGSLIKSLRKLVESPYVDSVNWGKWHVFWADERVVPKDHPDSNYKLAYDGFLSKVPIPPGQVYAINDSLSAEGAADDYETCLKHLVNTGVLKLSTATQFPKFDLMLLGMGPDGHIASLFPGRPLLNEKHRWVTHITDSPKPPPERITLTFPVINASSNIALVVAGAGKASVVQKALGPDQNSSDVLPVEMVSLEEGELKWFTDKDAASKLPNFANL